MNPDKRNQLILVILGAVAMVALVYTLGVSTLKGRIRDAKSKMEVTQRTLDLEALKSRSAALAVPEAKQREAFRQSLESKMPEGDVYSSLAARLEPISRALGIQDLALDRPGPATQCSPPGSAYPGLSSSLSGSGSFWQIGEFVAAFENELPFLRITHLTLDAGGARVLVSGQEDPALGFILRFEGCARANSVFR
jgi:hypothetical protein